MTNSKTKHTLGPWKIEHHDNIDLVRIGPGVAMTDQANAQLIAAAPEMLEALEATVKCLRLAIANGAFDNCVAPNVGNAALDQANAAINKARGEK